MERSHPGESLKQRAGAPLSLAEMVAAWIDRLFSQLGDHVVPRLYRRVLEQVERVLIEQALERSGGHRGRAARLLGLHTDGVMAVMWLLLELLKRGYKLVISTHSLLVMDIVWAMQGLKESKRKGAEKLLEVFQLGRSKDLLDSSRRILGKKISVVHLDYEKQKVVSREISGLDPGSENERESGWGGLLRHSTRIADIVAGAQ